MKIARTIGLAALAAMALMAFAGSSSALAAETTLCETGADSPYCVSEDRYPAETVLAGSASSAAIAMPSIGATVTCSGSTFETKTNAVAGDPLSATAPVLSFSGCKENYFSGKCTVKMTASESVATLAWTSGANGSLSANGVRLEVICSDLGVWCNYALGSSLTLNGGFSPALAASSVTLNKKGGYYCASGSASLSATYGLSSPSDVFVAKAEAPPVTTALCKVSESVCPKSQFYPEGTELKGTSSGVTFGNIHAYDRITCGKSSIALETEADYGFGVPLPMSRSLTFGECKMPLLSNTLCTMTSPTGDAGLSHTDGTLNGELGGEIVVFMSCPTAGFYGCEYVSNAGFSMTLNGGDPGGTAPKVIAEDLLLVGTATEGACTWIEEMWFSGTYTIASEKPVWVTSAF